MNKSLIKYTAFFASFILLNACADNFSNENPDDANFPYRLILDGDEGGDLADAEDYGVAIAFADYIGELPNQPITISYEIKDASLPVSIDKIVYEYEDDDCVFERELEFTADGAEGTITIAVDPDLGTVPEEFEVVFLLPAEEVEFAFEITSLETSSNTILGTPYEFEYASLDGDLSGEWVLEMESEEDFNAFKTLFESLSPDLAELEYADILEDEGLRFIVAQFEFEAMKFEIELAEEEEECVDGELESDNKQIELEADYEGEEGELTLEGSHFIINEDDGEIEDELDFIVEAEYVINEEDETVTITFKKIIDEDNDEEGEELFVGETSFTFIKD
jgi:hypothetical protein